MDENTSSTPSPSVLKLEKNAIAMIYKCKICSRIRPKLKVEVLRYLKNKSYDVKDLDLRNSNTKEETKYKCCPL